VSIFACTLSADRPAEVHAAARNALKRFKTLKHPYVIRFVDGLELEDAKAGNTVYIVTEAVTPLELELKQGPLPEAATAWGLRAVVSAVAFLHKGGLMHANVQV
jgi:SCY1-like protein 1